MQKERITFLADRQQKQRFEKVRDWLDRYGEDNKGHISNQAVFQAMLAAIDLRRKPA